MKRPVEEPTVDEYGAEVHPSWGLIGASRVSSSPPGKTLFDSDLNHQHFVVLRISQAQRKRDLSHDWIGTSSRAGVVEVAMSEAQWASFISTMNVGDGVPCTIERRGLEQVPGAPHSPRLAESMAEVREAASKSLEAVQEAFEAVKAKPTKANIRNLEIVLGNAPKNMEFAASSLTKHSENVVQRARADIEAMVSGKAAQLGLDPADVGGVVGELESGSD